MVKKVRASGFQARQRKAGRTRCQYCNKAIKQQHQLCPHCGRSALTPSGPRRARG